MQDRKGRAETVGFTLSAAVPVEAVGFVLKAMFDAGCPPNSLDLKAITVMRVMNRERYEQIQRMQAIANAVNAADQRPSSIITP